MASAQGQILRGLAHLVDGDHAEGAYCGYVRLKMVSHVTQYRHPNPVRKWELILATSGSVPVAGDEERVNLDHVSIPSVTGHANILIAQVSFGGSTVHVTKL